MKLGLLEHKMGFVQTEIAATVGIHKVGETYLCHQTTENATVIITINASVIKLQ